jgi:hypothetical protein
MLNIFVSHSWKNKTAAQLVADSFRGTADVWLDQLLGSPEHYLVTTPQTVIEFAAAVKGSRSAALRGLAAADD